MTPAPAACFIATPTLRSDGLSRRKTVLSGKVEAFSVPPISLSVSRSPLYLCLSLSAFLSLSYGTFYIVSRLFKLCVNMQKCKLLFALFISLSLSLFLSISRSLSLSLCLSGYIINEHMYEHYSLGKCVENWCQAASFTLACLFFWANNLAGIS